MKKQIFIILISFTGFISLGQNSYPSKKELTRIFKESIDQPERNSITTGRNPWIIENNDSAYYKFDTLKVSSFYNVHNNEKPCDIINWTFYRKDAFVKNHYYGCKKTPTYSVSKNEDFIKIKVVEKNSYLILEFYNLGKLTEKFKLICMEQKDRITVLTLERLK